MTPLEGPALREAIESRRLYALSTFAETGTLYVSNSVLAAFAACDLRAMLAGLGYVPRQGDDSTAPRDVGTAFHTAREVYFKTRSRAGAMAALRAAREWNEAEDDRLGWPNVSLCVDEWLDRVERGFPFVMEPELVEVPFLVTLVNDPPIVMGGKIDGLPHDDAGAYYVSDAKSTGQVNPRWLRQFRNNSQFSSYIWAARQHTSKPVVGALIEALEFSLLPGLSPRSPAKCRLHNVAYDECQRLHVKSEIIGPVLRSAEQIARWHRSAQALARRYHALVVRCEGSVERMLELVDAQGAFHGACQFCDFQEMCDVGATPHAIDVMLEQKGEATNGNTVES